MAKVYFTEKITSESLLEIYKKLNMDLKGKVAVKEIGRASCRERV